MSVEVEIDGEHHRVIPPSKAKLATLDATIERLEEAATERWGDRWFIQTTRYTDGDFRAHAICGHGVTDDGDAIEHRMFVNDEGEISIEKFVIESHDVAHEPVELLKSQSD